jgi:phage gpG-like protein
MAKSKFNTDKLKRKFEDMKRDLPTVLANQARGFFVGNFNRQSFTDQHPSPWAPRSTNKGARNEGRAILVKTGRLRRAVNSSLKQASFDRIAFSVSGVPYAKIHNEGGVIHRRARTGILSFGKGGGFVNHKKAHFQQKVNVGEHDIVMPQRRFMGDSTILRGKQRITIRRAMANCFK